MPERMIDLERNFETRPREVESHAGSVTQRDGVLYRRRRQPNPLDCTQHATLQIRLHGGRPLTLRFEDVLDLARPGSTTVVQPLHAFGHLVEGDKFAVERIFEGRANTRNADHCADVEQCPCDTRDPKKLAASDDIVRIDTTATMDNHTIHDRACAMRDENVHAFVDHLAQTPLLARCCECEHRRWVASTRGNLHLFATERPGR